MSFTPYWAIYQWWYMTCTLLYIRHSRCTCRIHGIGQYSTGDTWPVHFYTSDIHPVHVVNAVLGHIQPLIHSLYTFIHQTFTLHMSYTRYWAIFKRVVHTLYTFIHQTYTLYMLYTQYWAIFNRWYIAYTLLYIRHSPCTCHIHGIGPYSTGDTYPVHFYTSDIHSTCRICSIGPYSTGDT